MLHSNATEVKQRVLHCFGLDTPALQVPILSRLFSSFRPLHANAPIPPGGLMFNRSLFRIALVVSLSFPLINAQAQDATTATSSAHTGKRLTSSSSPHSFRRPTPQGPKSCC